MVHKNNNRGLLRIRLNYVQSSSVVDPYHFDPDPDPDPDRGEADPDPT